jgi:hypothetical protein
MLKTTVAVTFFNNDFFVYYHRSEKWPHLRTGPQVSTEVE